MHQGHTRETDTGDIQTCYTHGGGDGRGLYYLIDSHADTECTVQIQIQSGTLGAVCQRDVYSRVVNCARCMRSLADPRTDWQPEQRADCDTDDCDTDKQSEQRADCDTDKQSEQRTDCDIDDSRPSCPRTTRK